MDIITLDDFMDSVMKVSGERAEWKSKEFMDTLAFRIVDTIKKRRVVSGDVFTAYFHLYALLGKRASRERIRASALGVKDWLRSN